MSAGMPSFLAAILGLDPWAEAHACQTSGCGRNPMICATKGTRHGHYCESCAGLIAGMETLPVLFCTRAAGYTPADLAEAQRAQAHFNRRAHARRS